jgi:sRNA-binding carbon storage regulator CsrA
MASISSSDDSSGDDEILYVTSARRKLLVADIKDGKHRGKQPKELWLSRPEYQQDSLKLFRSRFYSIRKSLEENIARKEKDEKAFADDKKRGVGTTNQPYPKFKGSDAEKLLQKDLDEMVHESMMPSEIHKLHEGAYAPWPLEVFRNHIYQELKDRKQRPYWLGKRKEKEAKKIEKAKKKEKAKARAKAATADNI